MGFASGFIWGASTAAYQIEGGWDEDGKGLSVWDVFVDRPGAVYRGHTGRVACDHYHRWREDVGLMRELGLTGYRFSVSWPRVLPEGRGAVNERGLDFYDRLVDALREAGIEPFLTLFHWDYPYELYCRGGWLHPDSPDWFAEYVEPVVRRLSDRVAWWMTLNEPQVFIWAGHREGRHAPGLTLDTEFVVRSAHNVLLAHGKAVQAIRTAAACPLRVGFAPEGIVRIPATELPQDIEAARRATFAMSDENLRVNSWWMDPVCKGEYPQDGLRLLGGRGPRIEAGDMDTICQPLDFFGFNNYFSKVVRQAEDGGSEEVAFAPGAPHTAYQWDVTPASLPVLGLALLQRALRPAVDDYRERHVQHRVGQPRRRGARSSACRFSGPLSAGAAAGRRGGSARAGVLPVDADGQLRVGVWLRRAIWPDPR